MFRWYEDGWVGGCIVGVGAGVGVPGWVGQGRGGGGSVVGSVPSFQCVFEHQNQLGPLHPSGFPSDPVVRHLGLPFDNLISEQSSESEFLTLQIQLARI